MENYERTQLAKAVVLEAVDHCNEIENSLEGCLKVLQKIRMPYIPSVDDQIMDIIEPRNELAPKRSYTVCIGKKSPELIEIYDIEERRQDFQVDNLIESAERKLQNILKTQESILQRLEIVNKKIWKTTYT